MPAAAQEEEDTRLEHLSVEFAKGNPLQGGMKRPSENMPPALPGAFNSVQKWGDIHGIDAHGDILLAVVAIHKNGDIQVKRRFAHA